MLVDLGIDGTNVQGHHNYSMVPWALDVSLTGQTVMAKRFLIQLSLKWWYPLATVWTQGEDLTVSTVRLQTVPVAQKNLATGSFVHPLSHGST